jgi:hypothetical protein
MRIQATKMMQIHAVDSDSQPLSQLGNAIIVAKGMFYPTLNTQTSRKVYLYWRHILRLLILQAGITGSGSGSDNIGIRAHLRLSKSRI